MTLKQINKQIEKLEIKVSKLSRELRITPSTKVEMDLRKQKDILYHLEQIQYLIS